MDNSFSRRGFLSQGFAGISGAWLAAHWPAVLSASDHAHQAAKSPTPPKFDFFTPEEAVEIEAISSRIIPTTDTPGAREAGVVFFIDRALATFSKNDQKTFREGLPELQARVTELFPGTAKFSAATPEQQDEVLRSFDGTAPNSGRGGRRSRQAAQSFFETLRGYTIAGFLVDPESDRRGNRDGVGWKVIGRDTSHMFQSPFGYYDKDYPGWQATPQDAGKGKS